MTPRTRLSLFERLICARAAFAHHPHPNDCWLWFGARDAKDYGLIKVDGRCQRVHRVAYELATGRKLGRLTLDHTCRNPSCWRPSHQKPMTRAKNTAKGNRNNPRSTEKARAVRTAKLYGHGCTPESVRVRRYGRMRMPANMIAGAGFTMMAWRLAQYRQTWGQHEPPHKRHAPQSRGVADFGFAPVSREYYRIIDDAAFYYRGDGRRLVF